MSQFAITRTSNPITVKGVYFESFEKLKKTLLIKDFEKDCLVSDLTMASWRSHWVAREFISQLDTSSLSPRLFPRTNTFGNWENDQDYGLMVGKLIDWESSGDKNTIQAHNFALQILLLLQNITPKKLLLIAPKFNNEWCEENKVFINFLVHGLKETAHEFYIVMHSENNNIVHENWEVKMINPPPLYSIVPQKPVTIPGLIPLESLYNHKKNEDYIALNRGWALISPVLRRPVRYCFSDKAIRFKQVETESWVQDFIYFFGANKEVDLNKTLEIAGNHFSEGGFEIALRYIKRALEFCTDETRLAILQIQAQGMRIALSKFQEVADQSVPETSTIPNNLIGSLYLSKAWGLVAINKPQLAEVYFKMARRALVHFKDSIYYLHLLNLSALNKVKLNRIEAAFDVESEIAERITNLEKTNWQLYYVNCINQAELYKQAQSYKKSERYYQKAFSTTLSLRSESDLIYTNLCTSKLEQLKGNHLLSFHYLFRGIIHWLSMEVPESIAPKVASTILNAPIYNKTDLPDQISKKLIEHLVSTTQQAKILAENFNISQINPEDYVVFNRLDIQNKFNTENVAWVGNPGWSFILGSSVKKPVYQSKNYNILSSMAFKFAEKAIPKSYIPHNPIVLVDDQLGCEIPATKTEIVESALRTGIETIIYRRKKYQINPAAKNELENNLKMVPSPGIDHLINKDEPNGIAFKRYKNSIDLKPFRQNIFDYLNDDLSLDNLVIKTNIRKNDLLKELRAMEQKKIVKLKLDYLPNLQNISTIKTQERIVKEEKK